MQKSVTYMGCVISANGISPTEEKIEVIKQAPCPENSTQLRAFLGMVNYHGKFIRNLSTILQPLNQLLQKNQEFKWSSQCEQAFNKAKDSLSSSNVLVHYDPSLPVILENDASQYGIGAVILHRFPNGDERPIAYASRSLNSSERNYSQIENGMARMKAMARSHVWWPGIDSDIEDTVRECQQCHRIRKAPPASPLLPWSWPTTPWRRLHLDFATHQSNHYLVVVDAHSKWPEVFGPMKTTTAGATCNALRSVFARYGLPAPIVTDN